MMTSERDDFYSPIVNFPFISNNIPATAAFGVTTFEVRTIS